jgi:uncharacterized membrane protein YdjX (TVP38/TMEM64 family)
MSKADGVTPATPSEQRAATGDRARHRWRLPVASERALGVVVACALLALLASSDAVHSALIAVIARVTVVVAQHPVAGAVLFVALAAMSAMLAFYSSAPLVPVAVYAWGEPTSVLLLWVGWVAGGAASYAVGRSVGRPLVRLLARRIVRFPSDAGISERTPFTLVLLFQLALPSEVPGYVLGVAGYRFSKYLLALALAELPFAAGTVYLGASFLEGRALALVLVGAAGALVSALAFHALRKRGVGSAPGAFPVRGASARA